MALADTPFRIVRAAAETPVLLSVPHAGCIYPASLLAMARVPTSALAQLEDPLVDRLVETAIGFGAGAVIANAPRAEIDLNRSRDDIDPSAVAPPFPTASPVSRRALGGLGLVPTRLAGHGAIWRCAVPAREVARRLAEIYDPYHEAIAAELDRLRARFGRAVLLDCHSMPDTGAASVVIGDRHGTSTAEDYCAAIEAACAARGFRSARNHPYAGGEIVARHGRPREQVHALQIEIDRGAYLGPDRRKAGPGFARVSALIAAIVASLADVALGDDRAIAAE